MANNRSERTCIGNVAVTTVSSRTPSPFHTYEQELNRFCLHFIDYRCCMLHIFFSRRFAAIVDRLWMGPISLFYCRLYFYFVVTSAILTVSFIPVVSRNVRFYILEPLMGPWLLDQLQPLGDVIALVNLFQYAISSTTVICICWRTNYRIFTVANGKEAAANLRRRQDLARHLQHDNGVLEVNRAGGAAGHNQHALPRIDGVGPGDINAASHPLYHGPW